MLAVSYGWQARPFPVNSGTLGWGNVALLCDDRANVLEVVLCPAV